VNRTLLNDCWPRCRAARRGRTICLVEHDMKVVMGLCETVFVLDHGEKIAEGRRASSRPTSVSSKRTLAASAFLAGYLAGRSLGWPLIHDASLFHYIGWLVGQGLVPYRDIFDMNLPGIYLVHWRSCPGGARRSRLALWSTRLARCDGGALFAFSLPLGGGRARPPPRSCSRCITSPAGPGARGSATSSSACSSSRALRASRAHGAARPALASALAAPPSPPRSR
jgi:hypothetical protein